MRKREYGDFHSRECRGTLDSSSAGRPDVILLDIMLPDANGLDLVKKIRIKHPRIPIIFLTARKSDLDMILGLELGPMTMSQSLLIRGLS